MGNYYNTNPSNIASHKIFPVYYILYCINFIQSKLFSFKPSPIKSVEKGMIEMKNLIWKW